MRKELRPGTVVLAAGLLSPALGPGTALPRQPIRESIDGAAERVLEAHLRPCAQADEQRIPCFPALVEARDRLSVADSIRSYRPDGSPSPSRPPTLAETAPYRSGGPQSATGEVNLGDPVCAVKSLWKALNGKGGGPYYLYRTWDAEGEQPLLTDRELDPEAFRARPDFSYELVGKFDGECAAIAAWRRAVREAVSPPPPP